MMHAQAKTSHPRFSWWVQYEERSREREMRKRVEIRSRRGVGKETGKFFLPASQLSGKVREVPTLRG